MPLELTDPTWIAWALSALARLVAGFTRDWDRLVLAACAEELEEDQDHDQSQLEVFWGLRVRIRGPSVLVGARRGCGRRCCRRLGTPWRSVALPTWTSPTSRAVPRWAGLGWSAVEDVAERGQHRQGQPLGSTGNQAVDLREGKVDARSASGGASSLVVNIPAAAIFSRSRHCQLTWPPRRHR
ncbi:hypothetical protein SNOD_28960 [Streptomyces nodosus]|uniref:Uncharacterized protein n=1 Tax=Streptomyces nodosus TaxID=40318 RepID=A0A0B5DTY3_9ACTN|nr:hypothetical protein SNOD_28960 [Streptomyces nodosus]